MKIKELRLLNITVKQNEQILYQGKTEDIPKEISEMEYKKIYFEGVDVIVPVPLARRRERRRGYNQSLMIARGIGSVAGISVDNGLLLRIVDNPTQTMRTAKQRLENVEGIFRAVNEERIRGRHVLLVDDVVTTGATITACADRLVAAGARTISVLTLAASSSVGVF